MNKVKCLYCFLITLVLFSCQDNNLFNLGGPLQVSSKSITLSQGKPYAEITINKGAGNYRATSSKDTVAQYVLIENKLYITGFKVGEAIVTLTDKDNNQVEIQVKVKEFIARIYPLSSIVFVKIGDTRNIPNTDTNPLYYLLDTASVVQIGGTANNVQITGKKKGITYLYYLKEYWPTAIFNIQVIDHYPFVVSPSTNSLRLAVGAQSEYGITTGCGNYTVTVSNTNVLSAELLDWPVEPTFSYINPRVVHIKALQKGTSELKITNVETAEVKTVNVTVS